MADKDVDCTGCCDFFVRSVAALPGLAQRYTFQEYYEGQCLFHHVVEYLGRFGLFVHAFGVNTAVGIPVSQTDVLFMRSQTGTARAAADPLTP